MSKYAKSKIPKLFELMDERNITAAMLSRDLNISKGNITDWKMGRAAPSRLALIAVAEYLKTTPEYLCGADTTPTTTITGNYNVVGNHNSEVRVNANESLSDQETELLNLFRSLSEINKAKALLYIAELKK